MTDLAGAEEDFTEAIRLDPCYVPAYQWRSYVRASLGETVMALLELHECVRRDPGNALALRARSIVYARLNLSHEALLDFAEAVRLDPRLAPVFSNDLVPFPLPLVPQNSANIP